MNTDTINEIEFETRSACCSSSSCQSNQTPIKRAGEKMGRNDPCFCGSAKKYKKCCGK